MKDTPTGLSYICTAEFKAMVPAVKPLSHYADCIIERIIYYIDLLRVLPPSYFMVWLLLRHRQYATTGVPVLYSGRMNKRF